MYSYRELQLIAAVRRLLAVSGSAQGSIREFVQELVLADCDRIIPHCASLLPLQLHAALASYLEELAARDFLGRVVLIGPGMAAEEQASLRPRFRVVADGLAAYLRHPCAPDDMPPPDADLFWAWLQDRPRRTGVPCREHDCSQDALTLSGFCPYHQYRQIKGRAPPV